MSLKNVGGEWPPRKTHGMVYIRKKKTKPDSYENGRDQPRGGWWDDKKKFEAVSTYLAAGTLELTSAITNVPVQTLRSWKRTDWWRTYLEELQYEDNIQLDSKLEKILNKSLDAVMDRVENGDTIYDPRTGKQIRIPAKLRDVQKVTTDLIDKRQLLRKVHKPREEKSEQVTTDHLVQLAQAFAQFANKNKEPPAKEVNILDGEVLDAISEER